MDICEDNDIPVMTFLELGFEDQNIDFDLFVEDKPAPEQNVCL